MKRSIIIAVAAIYCTIIFSCNQPKGNYKSFTNNSELYIKTVKKLNDIVLENNFPPMIASRNYAYANIAAYEVVAAANANYNSLSGQIVHMPAMPKPIDTSNINFPLAAILAFCKVGNTVTFPEGSMDVYVNDLLHQVDSVGMPEVMINESKKYAYTVADSIISWSKKDNYAKLRSAPKFTVDDVDGKWLPTPPMYAQAVEPHWKNIRTLVLDSAAQFKPVPPPAYNVVNKSSNFYKAVLAVKQVGDSANKEQQETALFWDDNPFKMNVTGHVMYATKKFSPAGHWMNIVGYAAQNANADFNTTVYAYAKTAVALFDAFISCWDEKYRSNYVRPETVITKVIDANWQPFIQTPPFPEYTSGHAVISAAAAEVLTNIFGDNQSFIDSSELEFGIPTRTFPSFREAAIQAGISRFYGGIHFKNSCIVGSEQGIKVGTQVVQKLKMKNN